MPTGANCMCVEILYGYIQDQMRVTLPGRALLQKPYCVIVPAIEAGTHPSSVQLPGYLTYFIKSCFYLGCARNQEYQSSHP